jgi:hypothetical protein
MICIFPHTRSHHQICTSCTPGGLCLLLLSSPHPFKKTMLFVYKWIIYDIAYRYGPDQRLESARRQAIMVPFLRTFSDDGIFHPAYWGWGYKPTLFNSIFLLHSSFAAPFILSPAKLARNSYLLSRIAPLPFSQVGAMEAPHLYFFCVKNWANLANTHWGLISSKMLKMELFWKI